MPTPCLSNNIFLETLQLKRGERCFTFFFNRCPYLFNPVICLCFTWSAGSLDANDAIWDRWSSNICSRRTNEVILSVDDVTWSAWPQVIRKVTNKAEAWQDQQDLTALRSSMALVLSGRHKRRSGGSLVWLNMLSKKIMCLPVCHHRVCKRRRLFM